MSILSSPRERVAAVFSAIFFAFGIYLPFFPVLLADRGMGDTQIALLVAVPLALRSVLASPLGLLADWIGDRRGVLRVYSLIAAIAFTGFPFADGFWPLLVVATLTSLFSNASTPVADALATSVVRRGGGDYGRMRMWGSMSFVLANMLGGAMISGLSAHGLFWVLLVAFWGAALVLSVAPPRLAGQEDGPTETDRPVGAADVGRISSYLKDRVLMAGLAAAALIQGSHAMVYSFSSLYWGAIGFSGTTIGLFWATGVVAEILMFYLSGRLLGRWRPGQMLVLSGSAAVLRWCLFPSVSTFAGYLALQSLHSLTFACCHLAMMRLIVARVPDRSAATVQGLYATVSALTMSAATLASGPLYRAFGGQGFQMMAVLLAISMVLAIVWIGVGRQEPGDRT